MRRSSVAAVTIVLLACPLASCGKGGYSVTSSHASGATTATATSPATSTPAPTTRPPAAGGHGSSPTHAQALAFAHAVNLTAADVPGFTASPHRHASSPNERRLEGQLRSCLGTGAAKALGASPGSLAEVSSPDFQVRRGIVELSVGSEVSVAHSSAEAAAALTAIRSERVRKCLSDYMRALLSSQHYGDGARVIEVKLDSGSPPAPGTSGGFGWRVRATLVLRGVDLPFYVDILGFVYGPAQVTLTSTGDVRAFPAAAQEQLFRTLLARARAHKF
jgi:hypothetical protein